MVWEEEHCVHQMQVAGDFAGNLWKKEKNQVVKRSVFVVVLVEGVLLRVSGLGRRRKIIMVDPSNLHFMYFGLSSSSRRSSYIVLSRRWRLTNS